MKYRTEIDGLRAIAVMAVVIFHAVIDRLAGGYLGVDIFYVISGFLITSIILHENEAGAFSLMSFYRRRIVRILPALFVMLLTVLAVACVVAMPPDIAAIGKSSAAAAAFIANMHFWQTTGYFDSAAEAAPLLHTWSLGVEEQFYILYPLLLLAIARWRKNPAPALFVLCIVSFAVALWLGTWENESNFYLLPARAWQLGLGALVATGFFPAVRAPLAQGLAITGLIAITISFFIDADFSAELAVLPSLGAALVIAYGASGFVSNLLSLRPVRWIGMISYSLYLWHWPIMTYYRIFYGLDLGMAEEAGLIAASFLAAALSYYLVEQPFLRRFRSADSRKTALVGAVAIIAMIGTSLAVAARAYEWRAIPAEAARVAEYVNYSKWPEFKGQGRKGVCLISTIRQIYKPEECARLDKTKPNVALIGDSHAAHYWHSLVKRFPGSNIMQVNGASCAVLIDAARLERCQPIRDFAYGPLIDRGGLDHVILVHRWTRSHLPQLRKTILYLRQRGISVTVIGPVVEYSTRFPIALARSMETGNPADIDRLRRNEIARTDTLIQEVARETGASYYSAYKAECDGTRCAYVNPRDGAPIHFDYGHLTESGADYVLRDFQLPHLKARQ